MKLQKIFVRMRGLAVVEMAVVVPVFLIMLFGILEFGIVLYDKAIITNASLQLAQSGSQMTSTSALTPPTSTEVAKIVRTLEDPVSITNVIGNSLVSFAGGVATAKVINPNQMLVSDGLGYRLTVTVSYSYRSLVLSGLLKFFSIGGLSNPMPLNTTTSMYLN